LSVPGSAHPVLASGVVHLDEPSAVFEAMLSGWGRQQNSLLLARLAARDWTDYIAERTR
jgi:integrase/recombinase XerC